MLLNKQSRCLWFDTWWTTHDVTKMILASSVYTNGYNDSVMQPSLKDKQALYTEALKWHSVAMFMMLETSRKLCQSILVVGHQRRSRTAEWPFLWHVQWSLRIISSVLLTHAEGIVVTSIKIFKNILLVSEKKITYCILHMLVLWTHVIWRGTLQRQR